MKRIIFPWGVILVIISMTVVSYAEMKKIAISEGILADLKGKWTGSRTIDVGNRKNTDLEISNDSLPLKGKFIFYDVMAQGAGGRTMIQDFDNGKIDDQGNLIITSSSSKVELSLFEDNGKKKLEGNVYASKGNGTLSFTKR